MKDREPYIGGPTGGIPEGVFRLGFNDVISGVSEKTSLACKVNKDGLEIKDQTHDQFHLRMRYWQREEAVAFSVRTRFANQTHPDLYAAKLVEHGIAYFEEQGLPVNQMRGEWRPPQNDNYNQYHSYLKELMIDKAPSKITQQDREDAISQTWTGKLATSLGFDKIKSSEVTNTGAIVVFFSK